MVAGEGGDGAALQVRGADVAGQLDQWTEQCGRTAGRRRDGITRGAPAPARPDLPAVNAPLSDPAPAR
ncbi:hypothetical protein GCM10010310_64550 [Streptomyces violaceolatus]|uniref:Uncharacterized protein n=1 Tax=Streptomyces violaceolatus TaxID=67378 RepID=A0ABN3TBT1_9ACTN